MQFSTTSFWRDKRVLVTGHSGFKGSWICWWLYRLGAHVSGCSLDRLTNPSLFQLLQLDEVVESLQVDVRNSFALSELVQRLQPELIVHLAAQAMVQPSYDAPLETLSTNVMGTANLLEAVRQCESVRACLVVTSDKCYRLDEPGRAHRENDPLAGADPYSASKAAAEIVTAAYRDSFFSKSDSCSIASARAGNAIGGGDWSAYRLVPNSIRALCENEPIPLYGQSTVRPWQYVLEPLAGYLWLLQRQFEEPRRFAQAWNFGPEQDKPISARVVVEHLIVQWGSGHWQPMPEDLSKHEAPALQVSSEKSRTLLEWRSIYNFRDTITATVRSYRALIATLGDASQTALARSACDAELEIYVARAEELGLPWACAILDRESSSGR